MSTIAVYATPTADRRAPQAGSGGPGPGEEARGEAVSGRAVSGRAASNSAVSSACVRLTRRGRLVVFGAALLVALIALIAVAGAVIATSQPGQPVPAQTVKVTSGDTLWDIAATANPGGNVGATVHDIAALNGLSSTGALQVGQRIAVPLY